MYQQLPLISLLTLHDSPALELPFEYNAAACMDNAQLNGWGEKTATGKIQRFKLRELAQQGL